MPAEFRYKGAQRRILVYGLIGPSPRRVNPGDFFKVADGAVVSYQDQTALYERSDGGARAETSRERALREAAAAAVPATPAGQAPVTDPAPDATPEEATN